MSNLSGASTGSSSARSRGRVFGVPKTCHCGEQVMELISNQTTIRIGATFLANDNHTFKWVDEAHLDEIEALKSKTARLEEKLEAVTSERMNEFEKKLFERVEEALAESSSMTKKMVIVVVISCVVMVGFSKLY
ncbi:unnamed protein product [Microthlaspi erraticum]|uniref:Uncharacterized protein n=1 Tax=Microthlaspi erraticum TaxID=1685480 RepID=A0A6D2JJN8_9BRAS|nr:unnamed protein product [Microthlaspi erraticum]